MTIRSFGLIPVIEHHSAVFFTSSILNALIIIGFLRAASWRASVKTASHCFDVTVMMMIGIRTASVVRVKRLL